MITWFESILLPASSKGVGSDLSTGVTLAVARPSLSNFSEYWVGFWEQHQPP